MKSKTNKLQKTKQKTPKHYLTEMEFMAMFKWYMDHGSFDGYTLETIWDEWDVFRDKFTFSNLIQMNQVFRKSHGHFYGYIVDQFFNMANAAYANQHQFEDKK